MTLRPDLHSFLSARDGDRQLQEQAPIAACECTDARLPVVWANPEKSFQEMLGFGAAFTEAAAITWQQLGSALRQQVLQACFDPVNGHGYSLCRVHMNSCDFSLGNYAHAEVPGDVELKHFSIARDRHALIPFIKAAQQVAPRPLKLLASPWSLPAWMKSNGQMNQGGKLIAQYRAAMVERASVILSDPEAAKYVWGTGFH